MQNLTFCAVYRVTFIVADIGGDIYWNFFYQTLAEIPPPVTQKYCVKKFGNNNGFIGFLKLLNSPLPSTLDFTLLLIMAKELNNNSCHRGCGKNFCKPHPNNLSMDV